MERKPYHQRVAEGLIEQLKAGTAPWQQPWDAGAGDGRLPKNPVTNRRYRGVNALHLLAQGRGDNRWLTYKQALALGAQVRRGETGTTVQYWSFSESQVERDASGAPLLDEQGQPRRVEVPLERPRVFYAVVFNAEQIDGLPPRQAPPALAWEPAARAEQLLFASGAQIEHGDRDTAFYRPMSDTIHLPHREYFASADRYYATALHELGHWTGHSSRLGRDLNHPFGSEGYAREELRAEIASMLLGDELHIGHDPGQHASYVASWINILQNDPLEIFRAARDAESIYDYTTGLTQSIEHERTAPSPSEAVRSQEDAVMSKPKTYLNVPYTDREAAKARGARWDRQTRSWYVLGAADDPALAAWQPGPIPAPERPGHTADKATRKDEAPRVYLAVPYGERRAASAAGARWDRWARSWYVGPDADLDKLQRWMPAADAPSQSPALSPQEEFAETLRSVGCRVQDEHPIMDGAPHRIAVVDDKGGERSGFYVGHLDGHPAGYVKNHRSGVELTWKSKGYVLSAEQRAALHAQAASERQAREAAQVRAHEDISRAVTEQIGTLIPVTTPTAYLKAKNIPAQLGIFTDHGGETTYIPAHDADGKVWTLQEIRADGQYKSFTKGGKKEGSFHAVGGLTALSYAPVIVISEGYATASSNADVLQFATVAAFDSGNLPHVAKALHARFPNKPIVVAGDDDLKVAKVYGHNPGREKAEEAARAVNGLAIFPIFAPGEQSADSKAFTDFNDLATKSVLGKAGARRQLLAAVAEIQRRTMTLSSSVSHKAPSHQRTGQALRP